MTENQKPVGFRSIAFGVLFVLAVTVTVIAAVYWYLDNHTGAQLRPHEIYDHMKTAGPPIREFQDVDGKKIQVSDYSGKILIVNFWASWCPPCVDEIPSLVRLREKYKDKMHVIAVSSDLSMDDIQAFRKSFPQFGDPNFSIVWDQSKAMVRDFGIAKLPESVIFGPDGKAVKKIVGTIDWMADDAVAFMDEILTGKKQEKPSP